MKRKLLSIFALGLAVIAMNAQTVWNFSEAPFGAGNTLDFTSTFAVNGLTVATDGTSMWTTDANNKTIDGTAYTYRLKSGGGGSPAVGSKIPTTRFLSFNVSGPSVINIGMISSSSSASRIMRIVNTDQSVVDSIVDVIGTAAVTYTYNYQGGPSTIYLYSASSGINFYYLSATNLTTGTTNTLKDKLISIQENQIVNLNNKKIRLYNALGSLVVESNKSINTSNLGHGIYMLQVEGMNKTVKFRK